MVFVHYPVYIGLVMKLDHNHQQMNSLHLMNTLDLDMMQEQ